jgi:hypothetical protein
MQTPMGAEQLRQQAPHTQPLHLRMRPMRKKHFCNTEGETSMTKEEALKTMMLLSALESWAFSTKNLLPDYLHEELQTSMEVLGKIVLKEKL